MHAVRFGGAAVLLLTVAGCASIIEGTSQTITLNTNPPGADCALMREGLVIGRVTPTPGSVVVQKTKHDITIACTKEGYQEATYLNHSGAAGATFGNIVLGGGIGWAIDSASGADNKYDSPVNITLVPAPTPASVQSQTAPSAEAIKSAASESTIWNVGGVDVCGQPWSMKLQALEGKLTGELWRSNLKYNVAGLLSPQGVHHANALKAESGQPGPGPRALRIDLDLSKSPGTGVLWVDGEGVDPCRSQFQLTASGT
jgi:hypothetical protein